MEVSGLELMLIRSIAGPRRAENYVEEVSTNPRRRYVLRAVFCPGCRAHRTVPVEPAIAWTATVAHVPCGPCRAEGEGGSR